jgi:HSP20 family protein
MGKIGRTGYGFIALGIIILVLAVKVWGKGENVDDLRKEVLQLRRQVAGLEARAMAAPAAVTARSTANLSGPSLAGYDAWDPFTQMDILQRRMQALMGGFPGTGSHPGMLMPGHTGSFDPDYDIKENEKEYVLTFDIPGMDKASINVEVKNGVLVISGERSGESKEENQGRFYRQQRSFGYFSRAIALPEDASGENVQAAYENGVLTVTVARKPAADQKADSRKVEVK